MVYLQTWWCTFIHDGVPSNMMVYFYPWWCTCSHGVPSLSGVPLCLLLICLLCCMWLHMGGCLEKSITQGTWAHFSSCFVWCLRACVRACVCVCVCVCVCARAQSVQQGVLHAGVKWMQWFKSCWTAWCGFWRLLGCHASFATTTRCAPCNEANCQMVGIWKCSKATDPQQRCTLPKAFHLFVQAGQWPSSPLSFSFLQSGWDNCELFPSRDSVHEQNTTGCFES